MRSENKRGGGGGVNRPTSLVPREYVALFTAYDETTPMRVRNGKGGSGLEVDLVGWNSQVINRVHVFLLLYTVCIVYVSV